MKKKLFMLCLCLVLVTGCGKQIPKLKNGEEAVVTVNKEKISIDSLYEEMKEKYALQTLISMVDKKILEDKYKKNLDDANTYAESTMKSLKDQYGDELEQMIAYYGYQSSEAYKASVYLSHLQDLAVEDYAKKQIKDKDIKAYYKDEVIGDIEISHILITPEVKDDMTDAEKTKAETDAKTKAENLIKELQNTKDVKAKFTELAKKNSQDESTAKNGGSLGYINYGTLSENYDAIVDEATKLKNGAYSKAAIKTSLGYHIILRTNQKDKAKLDDVKDTIIDKLANELSVNDSTVAVKAMQELRKEYNVEIQDSELKKQYANYIQNALSQSQNNN